MNLSVFTDGEWVVIGNVDRVSAVVSDDLRFVMEDEGNEFRILRDETGSETECLYSELLGG